MRALHVGSALAALTLVGGAGFVYAARSSTLPDRLSMMRHDNVDLGGGPDPLASMAMDHSGSPHRSISVANLTGNTTGVPDATFRLTAEQRLIRLSSGAVVDAWTFNGQLPGPELRVRQGDLVEIVLMNKDIAEGVTIHWHGLDVDNVSGHGVNSVAA